MEENLNLDLSEEAPVKIAKSTPKKETRTQVPVRQVDQEVGLINCLKNEKITVRRIPKESGMITNPKHVFYGGMAENAVRVFTVPILESNGQFMNVLTNEEKAYLEEAMALEYNSLSVYKKENNFWENYTVRLTKGESYLDLSNPDDFIKYKVLVANRDFIASSLKELQDRPKATYQYVLIAENEESKQANLKLNSTMEAYMEFGKVQDDLDILRILIETIDGRPTSPNSKAEFLQSQASKLIQLDAKLFLNTIKDPYLGTKVLIKKSIEGGLISKRGNYLYLKSDNSPLCESNEEPTINKAAQYLNAPRHQELKLMLEARLK